MTHAGESIHELKAKISYLAEALHEAGKITSPSRRHLAEHCGINPKSLDSACRAERMTPHMQLKLSNECRFSLDESSWIDRRIPFQTRHRGQSVKRLDEAGNFRSLIRNAWGLDDGFFLSLSGFIPKSKDPDFASFGLTDFGQLTPLGSEMSIFLEMDLSPGYDENGLGYGFKKVRVRVELDRSEQVAVTQRIASSGPIELGGAKVFARGTRYEPCWEVVSNSSVLSGEYIVSKSQPLFEVHVGGVPCSISASLTVHLHDGSLTAVDGGSIPEINKARIVERLFSLMLEDEQSIDGRIKLCSQSLNIHRK